MVITGRMVLLTVLAAVPLAVWPSWETVGWILLVLTVLGVLDIVITPSPRLVEVQRTVSTPVRLGQASSCVLSVMNPTSRTLRLLIRDAWPPSAGATGGPWRWRGRPGERGEFTTELLPDRRGDRVADRVTVRSHGPLGLVSRQVSVEVPATVRVMPPFRSARHLPSKLARLRELEGSTTVMVRGQGSEFDSLRDYVIGDDVRSIDWRATARRQHVVVRTWRPERDRRVTIVIDSSRLSAVRVGEETRFDSAVEAGLLLAALASQSGDRVEVIAVDRRIRARVSQRPGDRMLSPLIEALGGVEPALLEPDWQVIAAAIDEVSRQRSLVVVLSDLNGPALAESLIPVLPMLLHRQHLVFASTADPELHAMLAEQDGVDSVYRAASAERAILERQGVATQLRAMGVDTLEAEPDELAPKLADLYIGLKASGRL